MLWPLADSEKRQNSLCALLKTDSDRAAIRFHGNAGQIEQICSIFNTKHLCRMNVVLCAAHESAMGFLYFNILDCIHAASCLCAVSFWCLKVREIAGWFVRFLTLNAANNFDCATMTTMTTSTQMILHKLNTRNILNKKNCYTSLDSVILFPPMS